MKKFSTTEVAEMLGLRQPHIQRAIALGKFTAPPLVLVGRMKIRLWSLRDVERARKQLKRPPKNGRRKSKK